MLVDDHQTVREGLRALFQSVPGVAVVHEAADGDAAIAAARAFAPDLLIIDLSMPRVNGLTVMRQLSYQRSQLKIVVLSRYRETAYVRDAFAAGARGYVLKQSSFEELRQAIDAVWHGRSYLDASLTSAPPAVQAPADALPDVSERELEVLRRAALGHANKEIGAALDIAVKTVEAHKSSAMKKLGMVSRRQLVAYAAMQGWFQEV